MKKLDRWMVGSLGRKKTERREKPVQDPSLDSEPILFMGIGFAFNFGRWTLNLGHLKNYRVDKYTKKDMINRLFINVSL